MDGGWLPVLTNLRLAGHHLLTLRKSLTAHLLPPHPQRRPLALRTVSPNHLLPLLNVLLREKLSTVILAEIADIAVAAAAPWRVRETVAVVSLVDLQKH